MSTDVRAVSIGPEGQDSTKLWEKQLVDMSNENPLTFIRSCTLEFEGSLTESKVKEGKQRRTAVGRYPS